MTEPLVRGSWPLTRRADDGQMLWHIAGSNPPEYAPDEKLEALWKQGQKMKPYYQDNRLTIYQANNLDVLRSLAEHGERFDLVEIDGPYGANLEGWDVLTEDEYLAHYTARLPLVRDCMQPWGVSFLFGYPEGCAEIKTWARQSGTLELRRWLTWYKQRTAHKGRKCETICMFGLDRARPEIIADFGRMLRAEREQRGWTLRDLGRQAGKEWWHRGGTFYYETGAQSPSVPDYTLLKNLFGFNDTWDVVINTAFVEGNYDGITNLDFINTSYPEDTRELNDAGLRSKPVGLYLDLFRPVVPPRDTKRALILYGGSGNAAIAAGQLGYNVTVCETDPARCEYIRRRWAWKVERRDETPIADLGPLFNLEAA